MLTGSSFYRDNPKLVCMGHPDSRGPCRYEPEAVTLRAARKALSRGVLTETDLRCIELDLGGYPGNVILGAQGKDPTGAKAKKARYACERAYSKIDRRLCQLCSLLWAADKPKGPRVDAGRNLKYPREDWRSVRKGQEGSPIRLKRRTWSVTSYDPAPETDP